MFKKLGLTWLCKLFEHFISNKCIIAAKGSNRQYIKKKHTLYNNFIKNERKNEFIYLFKYLSLMSKFLCIYKYKTLI